MPTFAVAVRSPKPAFLVIADVAFRLKFSRLEELCDRLDPDKSFETASAAQDYIQLYNGDSKLLTESLEHIQQTATQILNAIGAEEISAPIA